MTPVLEGRPEPAPPQAGALTQESVVQREYKLLRTIELKLAAINLADNRSKLQDPDYRDTVIGIHLRGICRIMQLENDLEDAKQRAQKLAGQLNLAGEIRQLRDEVRALSDRIVQNRVPRKLFLAVRSDSLQIATMIKKCYDDMVRLRETHKIVTERIHDHPILGFFEQLAALSPPG